MASHVPSNKERTLHGQWRPMKNRAQDEEKRRLETERAEQRMEEIEEWCK